MSEAIMLGAVGSDERGYSRVDFTDANGLSASLQCSSAIGDYGGSVERPGASYLWMGINEANPLILASKAAQYGVRTMQTTGWVSYPVPSDVQMQTRMHLNREQVAALILRLQQWLAEGHF